MAGKLPPSFGVIKRLDIAVHALHVPCYDDREDANGCYVYADEPRRSGRPTKGQHRKDRDLPEEKPTAKGKKGKGKSSKAASTDPEPEEDDAIIRCICGATEDDEGLMMIVCDKCEAWQHNLCMGVTEVEDDLPEAYYCEQCAPNQHAELLAAIKRGEKPWEAKKKQRQEEEKAAKKAKRGKKGKGGGTKARPSDVTGTPVAADSPAADSTVKTETGNKRKLGENGFNEERQADLAKEPQDSPLLQKRRKSSHQAIETPVSDRRQSIALHRRESAVDPIANSIDELAGPRKKIAETLAKDLTKLINEATKAGSFRIPDGHTPTSLSAQIALQIEYGLYEVHAPEDKGYADQFRSIHFNLPKNKSLSSRILSGSLPPEELAIMSSDDMASEELQKKMAVMKEEADKQSILIQEEGPRIRKTHKGEEIIDDASVPKASDDAVFAAPPIRRRPTEDTEMRDADAVEEQGNIVELPEDVGNRRPLTVDTSTGAPAPAHARRESAAFDINSVWSSVHSPDHEGVRLLHQPPRRRSSAMNQEPSAQAPPQSAIVDDDVDRLLKDDEPTDLMTDYHDPDALWNGKLVMASLGEFHATAKWVAGGDPSGYIPWIQLLPPVFEVSGRIPTASADEYIAGMRYAGRGTDVTILSISPVPTGKDEAVFDQICTYFNSRSRWGVLGTSYNDRIKDSYLIPVEAGDAPLPGFLHYLEDSMLEQNRPNKMLLACMVLRGPTAPPSAEATPAFAETPSTQGMIAGAVQPPYPPSSSAPTPQAHPQFSPVVHQGSMDGTPPTVSPSVPPLAAQILGDFINTPTVQMMMATVPDMSENQLRNLRDVLEKAPETRNDVGALAAHLKARSGGED
ncbi:hypothetical protein NA57DRAFT_40132 [Rhizodiscina lignyota]|uniref:Transcription factor BYE1 n=1 Tax=Rhizodiscina lignyota TaxID=1504668 RepID=A0A9P4IF06_9PEZI|nr:hypothetical protein NA57DRAFT_40132 [Rhizodiscina lignyota]